MPVYSDGDPTGGRIARLVRVHTVGSTGLLDTSAALRRTTERMCVDQPMTRAGLRAIMCELQREDSGSPRCLLSLQLAVDAPTLQPPGAAGRGRLDALQAASAARLGAESERLVGELLRGDLS